MIPAAVAITFLVSALLALLAVTVASRRDRSERDFWAIVRADQRPYDWERDGL